MLRPSLLSISIALASIAPAGRAAAPVPPPPQQQQQLSAYCGAAAGDDTSPAAAAKTLADLVGIAMRQNSETRIAWLQAEDAALELGISRSKYGPIIAAQAVALHDHAALPLPKNLNPRGYFKSDAEGVIPALTLKWLLYDGGGKDAVIDRAGEMLAAANFGFSSAHRRVTILVTQQFFRLVATVARLAAAQATLHSAQAVEQLAQARNARGIGTAPAALQARAQVAAAQLALEEADAAAQDALMALLEASGLRPDTATCVAIPTMTEAGAPANRSTDQLIERAIANRPEIGAALAQVHANDAAVRQARSEYGPKLLLAAHAGQNVGRLRSDGGDWSHVNQPVYGIGLTFEIPIYDGQIRNNQLASAQSKVEAATAQLDGIRNKVLHEVVKASRDLNVAASRRAASATLLDAATASFDATFKAYRQGLATMPELQSATAALASARMADSEARANVLTARAVLSFASGDMIELDP